MRPPGDRGIIYKRTKDTKAPHYSLKRVVHYVGLENLYLRRFFAVSKMDFVIKFYIFRVTLRHR